jgi:hypothetical protein
MKPVYRSRLVIIPIPTGTAAGVSLPFPDQPDLKRPARVTAFETFTATDLTISLQGAVISPADALNTLVTLSEGSDERVRQLPYASARAAINGGQLREVKDFEIEWTQCKLQCTAALTANTVALVMVHFFYPDDLRGR